MKSRIIADVGFFYCPYIPEALMRVNRDADPPEGEEWINIMHHDLFAVDLEWDPEKEADRHTDLEEQFTKAYDYAKKAIERM